MTARSKVPFDPRVVAPWQLGSGPRGAVLLHGFAGTPPELRRLGEHLADRGWRVCAPALAGHATSPEDMAKTTWRDWAASARTAVQDLQRECDAVVVAGQSMGGTLALHLAATDPSIVAVASLATPIWISGATVRLIPLAKHVVRWYVPSPDVDLFDPGAVEELWSYGKRSTRALHELFRLMRQCRDELPMIRQPVLLLHGGRDRTVDPRNAEDIERGLVCSALVERQLFPRSGHAMSVDADHDEINQRVAAWFERHLPDDSQAGLSTVEQASA
ncbi:MAG: alpha/beta fold hydrolase [Candidatus Dormibacteria bacterium]